MWICSGINQFSDSFIYCVAVYTLIFEKLSVCAIYFHIQLSFKIIGNLSLFDEYTLVSKGISDVSIIYLCILKMIN